MADEMAGKARHVKGRIKEGLGDLLGDRKLEREGELNQMEGRAEQDASRAEEELREATERKTAAELARKRTERN